MSPTAFVRRPLRWITALSDEARDARVITAAPNFAYEWAALRGRPDAGTTGIDLANVVLIIGSEPVSPAAIRAFEDAFGAYGLPRTAFKPSYGIAEATLFVSTIGPRDEPTVTHLSRRHLETGQAVVVSDTDPQAQAHVACGQVARSLAAVIVDPTPARKFPTGSRRDLAARRQHRARLLEPSRRHRSHLRRPAGPTRRATRGGRTRGRPLVAHR